LINSIARFSENQQAKKNLPPTSCRNQWRIVARGEWRIFWFVLWNIKTAKRVESVTLTLNITPEER
jgi:hypothetical protein